MKKGNVRQLAAVMFTDIVGYTALMQADEDLAVKTRARHREVFERQHEIHEGKIIQYYGDGTLSVFKSAIEAIQCAIKIQQILRQGHSVPLRMGLHMGDIVFNETEVYGDGVNLTSRIENISVAGAILISGKLNAELKNHPQITTRSLGDFQFKNITEAIEVFVITNEGLNVPTRSDLIGASKAQTKSIAVLPFVNMSSNTDNEYFSDGITEEIINALAKIKNLKVTSRTSSFFFKNKNIPIPQIGKELQVSTILEGSIRLSGNKMRITAQLINVENDFHFWSETFDRSMEDIFAVQDEVSLLIADKLREHLGHFDIDDHLVDTPNVSVEMYKNYLQGRYYLMKLNLPGTEKSISIFKEIIAAQPDFTLPYLAINQGYAFLGTMGLMPAQEAFIKAKPFLDKALELDKNLPESQLNLSWICMWQNWDIAGAYRHIHQALDLRPTDEMYLTVSSYLATEGKFEAAINYIDKALQLDPFSGMNHHFKGFIYYLQEKYERAIPYFKKSLQLKSDLPFPHLYWGESLILMGREKEGLTFFQNLPTNIPGDLTKLGGTTLAYAALNDKVQTATGISELEAELQTDSMGSAINFLILVHTMMGNYDKAIQWIEQGMEYKLPMMLLLYTEPILKPLRSIPRFQEWMQQIFNTETGLHSSERKYKKSLFNTEQQENYKKQLEDLMDDKKPYLDPQLTLRNLAQMMDIPANHLSQLLNEGFHKNFAEFVNSYRLEAFKLKAADSTLRHLTLLALAYDSGFNSKTVFNTYFRKKMGETPKAYLAKQPKDRT